MIEYLTSKFIIPCSIFVIRFFKVSFSICLDARGQRLRSYETTSFIIPYKTIRHKSEHSHNYFLHRIQSKDPGPEGQVAAVNIYHDLKQLLHTG